MGGRSIRISYNVDLEEVVKDMFNKNQSEDICISKNNTEFYGRMIDTGIDIEDQKGNQVLIKWEVFNEIDKLFNEYGERVQKGDAKNYRLGQSGLGIDTIEGRVAHRIYNKGLGDIVREKISIIEVLLIKTGFFIDDGEYIKAIHPMKKEYESKVKYKIKDTSKVKEDKIYKVESYSKSKEAKEEKYQDDDIKSDYQKNKDSGLYGKLILDTLKKLARENMINPFAVKFLLDDKHSSDTFGIEESLLREIKQEKSIFEQRYSKYNDKHVYFNDVIKINGDEYLLYNDWKEENKEKFLEWLKKLLRSAKR